MKTSLKHKSLLSVQSQVLLPLSYSKPTLRITVQVYFLRIAPIIKPLILNPLLFC